MNDVVLYSTNCPKCKVLVSKLNSSGIKYEVCSSVEKMISLGISSVPMLGIGDKLYTFSEAITFLNSKL